VAHLLLQFLLEIPHTLLTHYRYDKFMDASGMCFWRGNNYEFVLHTFFNFNFNIFITAIEDPNQRATAVKAIVESLPQTNRTVLKQLIEFLTTFGANHPPFTPLSSAIMRPTGSFSLLLLIPSSFIHSIRRGKCYRGIQHRA
jgi:RhoGAP domain